MRRTTSIQAIEDEFERVLVPVIETHERRDARAALKRVIEEYGKPHRVYHSVEHLEHVLRQLQWWERRLSPVEYCTAFVALVLHDYVYEIPAGDESNEALSADALAWFLRETGLLKRVNAKAARQAILATEGHNVQNLIDLVVCWCDLWGLSRSKGVVEANGDKIRQEYTKVYTEEEYAQGRRKFLESYMSPFKVYRGAPWILRIYAMWLNFKANRHLKRELRCLSG